MLDVDLGHAGTGGEDERLRELLLADRAEGRLERRAPVGVEGATEVRDRYSGEATQHPVDEERRHRAAPGVATGVPPAARDVASVLHARDELRNVLRGVLEVSVHRDEDVALSPHKTRVHRRVLAEVALEPDAADVLSVGGVRPFDRGPSAVGGSVVHEDDLPGPSELLESRHRAADDLGRALVFVVEGHNDRDLGRHGSSLQLVTPWTPFSPNESRNSVMTARTEPAGWPAARSRRSPS